MLHSHVQVTRLGTEDRGFSKRELYLRNVSSHSLDKEVQDEEELPEPQRSSGEIIAFRRCCFAWSSSQHLMRAAPCPAYSLLCTLACSLDVT